MDLRTLTAIELGALAEEEVVPLAADLAPGFGDHTAADLRLIIARLHDGYQKSGAENRSVRTSLLQLLATLLAALAAGPRDTVLCQRQSNTRPVRLREYDFARFLIGRKRHVSFERGMWPTPHEGDVLRLLEVRGGKWTDRDVYAEITDLDQEGDLFIASVRPWRGAGTESLEQALVNARKKAIDDAADALCELLQKCGHGTVEARYARAALERVECLSEIVNPVRREPLAAE